MIFVLFMMQTTVKTLYMKTKTIKLVLK